MNTSEVLDDVLFEVERRIARRADELDRQFGITPGRALEHWQQAEQEIWANDGLVTAHDQELVGG
jgi:hypothetical protein